MPMMQESNKKTFEDVGKRKKRGENNNNKRNPSLSFGFGRRVRATNNFNFFVQYHGSSKPREPGGIRDPADQEDEKTDRPRRQDEGGGNNVSGLGLGLGLGR